MHHSIVPKDRIYEQVYGFLSFAKNMSYTYCIVKNFLIVLKKNYNRCNKKCFEERNSKNSRSNW